MRLYNLIKKAGSAQRLIIIIFLVSFSANSLLAQGFSTILGLTADGVNVESLTLKINPPGSGINKSQKVFKGYKLISGTSIEIPPNTMVELQSPTGRQEVKSTSPGKSMEYTVNFTSKGEDHIVKGEGQIKNFVNKIEKYNYKNSDGSGTTAASKGTVFTFTETGNKQATITTEQGKIIITDEVPVRITNKSLKKDKDERELKKAVTKIQSAGDKEYNSVDDPVEYDDYNEAINSIKEEVTKEEQNYADPDDLAEDYTCLGELYMDMGQPENAVQPFKKALLYNENEYGPDDPETLESKINLAEALTETEDVNLQNQGKTLVLKSIQILEENLRYDKQDYGDEDDAELQDLICEDIVDKYKLLGRAYHIAGNDERSNEYSGKAGKGKCD
jgi:hypothetical protein